MEAFSNAFANNVLSSDITNSQTTMVVTFSTNYFPTTFPFMLRVDNELVAVTSVAGSSSGIITYNIVRGREGTTGAAHTAGALVSHVLTAAALDRIIGQRVPVNCNDFRLSLSSSDPAPNSDTNASTIYLLPFFGNRISLWDTTDSVWKYGEIDDANLPTLSIPTSSYYTIYDVFLSGTVSSPTLTATAWNTNSKTITNITAGYSPTVTTSAAHGFATGEAVAIRSVGGTMSALNDCFFQVTVVSSTTFTLDYVDTTGLTFSGTPLVYNLNVTRATNLTRVTTHCYVHSLDPNKRYLGSFFTRGTSGSCSDTAVNRNLFNLYNKVDKDIYLGLGPSTIGAYPGYKYYINYASTYTILNPLLDIVGSYAFSMGMTSSTTVGTLAQISSFLSDGNAMTLLFQNPAASYLFYMGAALSKRVANPVILGRVVVYSNVGAAFAYAGSSAGIRM